METRINALVTGGSRGIGNAIAKRISKRCENLFITSSNEKSLLKGLSSLKEIYNGNLYGQFADHNESEKAAIKIKELVTSKTEFLDVLVLNAGMFIEGDLSSIDSNSFISNMEVNFSVNYFIVKELLPLLRKSNGARIIVIGSTAAYEAYPLVPTYGIAKWALRGFCVNLRKELMNENIGVTFISPGGTLTDMWEGEELPANRLLEPDDIAKVIDNLLTLSNQAVVEELIIRPMLGDIHE
jgi:short-subunit dehydrogenase